MAKRKIQVAVGSVFAVPLKDGSGAVGQVIESIDSLRAALCVFYSYKTNDSRQEQVFAFKQGDVVAVKAVSIRPLQLSQWETIGNRRVANPDLRRALDGLREVGFVGLSIPNSLMIEALMNAHHGLAPWEIGTDADFLRRLVYRQP